MAEITTETTKRERTQPLCTLIATAIGARLNCQKSGNSEWLDRWEDLLTAIERNLLPSGSGIDSGTKIDLARSTADRIVLTTAFHHMNDGGMYDGWTEHTITIRPSFIGMIDVRISGRDRNGIKDYLADTFNYDLTRNVIHDQDGGVRWADR